MPLSRDDRVDLLLVAIAVGSVVALVKLTRDYMRPLPVHRRVLAQMRQALGQ